MKTPRRAFGNALTMGLALLTLLALVALAVSACDIAGLYFDDPAPDLVVELIDRVPASGGTYYYGTVRNSGGIAAENIYINITPRDGGGASLGTYRTPVSVGYTPEEVDSAGTVTEPAIVENILEPGETGGFNVVVPVALGSIASEEISFDFTLPVEEEEEEVTE